MYTTRKEAKFADELRYNTGTPCKNGHRADRYVSNGRCITCGILRRRILHESNPNQRSESQKRWRKSNPDKCRAMSKRWRTDNPDKMRASVHAWTSNNQKVKTALQSKRKANLLLRTPKWADLEKIKTFYISCPPGYTVDHIVPLQGRHVCGLHVLDNLQYLTLHDNSAKGNRHV